jgi:glutaredoxin
MLDCGDVCTVARAFLTTRRIPFTEIKLDELSEEDFQKAAQRMGANAPRVPFLTVGAQKLVGFEKNAWDEMLDLAGYPRVDISPANPADAGTPVPATP